MAVSKKLPIITPPKLQGVTDQIDALDHKLAVIRVRMILHLMYITLLFLICNPLYFLKIFPNDPLDIPVFSRLNFELSWLYVNLICDWPIQGH